MLKYRVSSTLDPEERLEDAAMAKAMSDVFGEQIEIVSDGDADFGRDRYFDGLRKNIRYWEDPAFLRRAEREIHLCDVDQAKERISELHGRGKDAFVKSTDLKWFAKRVPVGMSLGEALEEIMFGVIDRPPCILVQEACTVEWEQRFVVVGRNVVAHSSVATHLTPIEVVPFGRLYRTPKSRVPEVQNGKELFWLAMEVAEECREENVVIDCAFFDGRPAVVEFNPFSVGNFGLYTCSPHAIAQAVADQEGKRNE